MRKSYFAAYRFCFAICFFTQLLASCKKDKSVDGLGSNTAYEITTLSNAFIGEPFQFHTNAPASTQLEWIFGDSTSSRAFAPIHIYKNYGEYFVAVIVNGDSSNHLHKNTSINITVKKRNNPADFANISGNRYWAVIKDSTRSVNGQLFTDTLANFNDTFSIIKLDDETIVIKGDTLKNTFAGFVDSYVFYKPSTKFFWEDLTYYYRNDSVVYRVHPDQGGWIAHYPGGSSAAFGTTTHYFSHK